ncbi:hypothetical protein HAHI6034_13015 [Hathewaya histolytica]|uniref:Dipeptidyl peptidase IV n=1 Tax=Hathewaya histolytica TaxID=1498 RepID=A0A4U9R4I7_HATHI|nr:hypothetical protein [Hathewaya histolytica]VTQ86009.1 dipeptidyl peptidase IV [Hathewaya histolytica]
MKVAKKILIWTFIALLIQLPIYYFADRYIMIKENIRLYKKDMSVIEDDKIRNINVPINGRWDNIKISNNGKYISYIENNILSVQNMDNNEKVDLPFNKGVELAYYEWIPSRDRMIIIEKTLKEKDSVFTINYYDALNKEKIRVKEISYEENPAYVNDVQVSLLTGIMYINIVHKGDRSSIYRIDISENINAIDTKQYFIDKLCLVPSKDRLVYEDRIFNKIYYLDFPANEGKEVKVDEEDQLVLLGCDAEGIVYLGGIKNGKVYKVYYSKGDENITNYRSIDLNESVEEKNIYVNRKGGVYIIDKFKNTITLMNGRTEITTHIGGEFISFYDQGYLYKVNNTLKNEFLGQLGHK